MEKFIELTVDEFDRISNFLYRKTGMKFEPKKIYFITNRINKRLKILGLTTISDYIKYLQYRDKDGTELQELINLVTVNETYFFRDYPQLEVFSNNCLKEVVEKKFEQNDNYLKIWSAGCSTGEEPYTIGIILTEMLENINDWNISIIASDIDKNVLKKAQDGEYDYRSVKDVPEEYLKKYFIKTKNDTYLIKENIKKLVKFEYLNLSDKLSLRNRVGFDFIFCRNVLIYFDDISRRSVVDHFYIALNKGGYIFLGSSESLGRITTAFKLKRMNNYLVYTKE